jgi:hypothetical protein
MSFRSWRRAGVIGLIAGVIVAPLSGSAQEPTGTVVAELVVVAPASGPAWWKVSKGDASVWILGLPLNTPEELRWDKSTLERRLKGARLIVGVYNEEARLERGSGSQPLPPELKEEISAISRRLAARRATSFGMTADRPPAMMTGEGGDRFASLVSRSATGPRPGAGGTVLGLVDLRYQYALANGLCFCVLKPSGDDRRSERAAPAL